MLSSMPMVKTILALYLVGMSVSFVGCSREISFPPPCVTKEQTNQVDVTTPDGQWRTNEIIFNYSVSYGNFLARPYIKPRLSIQGFYPDSKSEYKAYFFVDLTFDKWSMGDVISLSDSSRVTGNYAGAFYKGCILTEGRVEGGRLKVLSIGEDGVHIRLEGLQISGISVRESDGESVPGRVQWSIDGMESQCIPDIRFICSSETTN